MCTCSLTFGCICTHARARVLVNCVDPTRAVEFAAMTLDEDNRPRYTVLPAERVDALLKQVRARGMEDEPERKQGGVDGRILTRTDVCTEAADAHTHTHTQLPLFLPHLTLLALCDYLQLPHTRQGEEIQKAEEEEEKRKKEQKAREARERKKELQAKTAASSSSK